MRRHSSLFFIAAIAFLVLFYKGFSDVRAATSSDNVQVNLNVEGCNNNGMCEPIIGEDILSCALDCTPAPDTTTSRSGSVPYARNAIVSDIRITPSETGARVEWRSTIPTIATLRWGTTVDLSLGTQRSIAYTRDHVATITGLASGTAYYLTIESENRYGEKQTSPLQVFFTTPRSVIRGPQNPSQFIAVPTKETIELSWHNPPSNFAYVRLMRNTDRYRTNPQIGELVYEGREETVSDTAVQKNTRYFYSLFARDEAGNYSSGTIASAIITTPSIIPPPSPTIPTTNTVVVESLYPYFTVIQDGRESPFTDNIAKVRRDQPFVVTAVPGGLRGSEDAWIELTDQSGKQIGVFLFAYDKKRNEYYANIPALTENGLYTFTLFGFADSKAVTLGKGKFSVFEGPAPLPGDISLTLPWWVRTIGESTLIFIAFFIVLRLRKYGQR